MISQRLNDLLQQGCIETDSDLNPGNSDPNHYRRSKGRGRYHLDPLRQSRCT
ncbi:hypothetical protein [Cohnella hongkongensis]|uniref:Uncharacterized protein n=1 Tax=Cohnella hongkongensis TaxID=178337 RepID=A0ABV9FI60_9BACL